tara:strand:- start:203 stop:397 length:195 start_codon:yes stop_codon:yes gene_type:complete
MVLLGECYQLNQLDLHLHLLHRNLQMYLSYLDLGQEIFHLYHHRQKLLLKKLNLHQVLLLEHIQ